MVIIQNDNNNPFFGKEKSDWVQLHGSEMLKWGLANGYDIDRVYVYERAEKEFPRFHVLEFSDERIDNYCEFNKPARPTLGCLYELSKYLDTLENKYFSRLMIHKRRMTMETIFIDKYLGKYTLFLDVDIYSKYFFTEFGGNIDDDLPF